MLTAEKSLLLDEPPGHLESVPVVGLHPLVHHRPVQDGGDEVVADALDLLLAPVARNVDRLGLRLDPRLPDGKI